LTATGTLGPERLCPHPGCNKSEQAGLAAWEHYKLYIIGAAAFFLAETSLIIFLIVHRRRRRSAEESLRQKTEELDQFFNVTLDLLFIANTKGYFVSVNHTAKKVLGYTPEELMARPFFDFVHPDDVDRTREAFSVRSTENHNENRNGGQHERKDVRDRFRDRHRRKEY